MYTYLFLFSFMLICLLAGLGTDLKWWRYFILGGGIIVGVLTLTIKQLAGETFAASTPIRIEVENRSKEKLHVYVVTVLDPKWAYSPFNIYGGKRVGIDKYIELAFEADSALEFWVVASNADHEIVYLEKVDNLKNDQFFSIQGRMKVDMEDRIEAYTLIKEKEVDLRQRVTLRWINISLIILLFLNLVRK